MKTPLEEVGYRKEWLHYSSELQNCSQIEDRENLLLLKIDSL